MNTQEPHAMADRRAAIEIIDRLEKYPNPWINWGLWGVPFGHEDPRMNYMEEKMQESLAPFSKKELR